MPASPGSVSGGLRTAADATPRVVFSGVNWLGDSLMSMPAIREFKRRNPSTALAMVCKQTVADLWRMEPCIDSVTVLGSGPLGVLRAARAVRRLACGKAFVLTQSFRSALVPFLARVPERVGMPGHDRDWMLTGTVRPGNGPGREHQAFEYYDLLGCPDVREAEPLLLSPGDETLAACRSKLSALGADIAGRALVAMLPGAARGPSKRWPARCFAAVARRLAAECGCVVLLFGGAGERDACEGIAREIGVPGAAVNMAGQTALPELAGMLSLCRVAVANDSGGMHLAAAVGTCVVAIYGATDPARTGPMGKGHRVICAAGVDRRSRDIDRDSGAASLALSSVSPDTVLIAVVELLAR